ncbi:peptide chain release factor N(5)-glutamine methyltransferase [Diaphorobacter ruginosibacter]|uniref:peptide chain release factor N(5)-glutamine methyltransferase n=1 Tax=Diaphorobacter ruginosibacter TaxID=1715720 RepID=UPI00333FADD6
MTRESPRPITQCLADAARLGIARVDAQMLMLHAMGQPTHARAWLITHDGDIPDAGQLARWESLCAQRLDGVPVAYLTGSKEFYGLSLQVDARVLDPRPDTETLVDWVLELFPGDGGGLRMADLGTGSGAIALALQRERPRAEIWAVDASADALAVAQANARRLGLAVRFAHGSWLSPLGGTFDAIISNPPYIRSTDPHLAALRHEPLGALASGADGLDDIRLIVGQSIAHLKPGAWLLLEHGWDQSPAVQQLLRETGFSDVHSRNDLSGIARCTGGKIRK